MVVGGGVMWFVKWVLRFTFRRLVCVGGRISPVLYDGVNLGEGKGKGVGCD